MSRKEDMKKAETWKKEEKINSVNISQYTVGTESGVWRQKTLCLMG